MKKRWIFLFIFCLLLAILSEILSRSSSNEKITQTNTEDAVSHEKKQTTEKENHTTKPELKQETKENVEKVIDKPTDMPVQTKPTFRESATQTSSNTEKKETPPVQTKPTQSVPKEQPQTLSPVQKTPPAPSPEKVTKQPQKETPLPLNWIGTWERKGKTDKGELLIKSQDENGLSLELTSEASPTMIGMMKIRATLSENTARFEDPGMVDEPSCILTFVHHTTNITITETVGCQQFAPKGGTFSGEYVKK